MKLSVESDVYWQKDLRITWFAKAASQVDFIGYANRDAKHAEMVKYLSISEGHGTSMDQRVHPVKIIPTGEFSCDDIVKNATTYPSKQG